MRLDELMLRRILFATLCLFFTPGSAVLSNTKERSAFKLEGTQLGESYRSFRHRYHGIKCHRRISNGTTQQELKQEWFKWIDCSIIKGVSLDGAPVLGNTDETVPVGLSAVFEYRKLVSLEFVVGIDS